MSTLEVERQFLFAPDLAELRQEFGHVLAGDIAETEANVVLDTYANAWSEHLYDAVEEQVQELYGKDISHVSRVRLFYLGGEVIQAATRIEGVAIAAAIEADEPSSRSGTLTTRFKQLLRKVVTKEEPCVLHTGQALDTFVADLNQIELGEIRTTEQFARIAQQCGNTILLDQITPLVAA